MASGLLSLPPDRSAQLIASYSGAITRRRFKIFGVVIAVAALMTVAGRVGEVDPLYLVDHFSNFTSYFGRILPRLNVATLRMTSPTGTGTSAAGSSCWSIP